MDALFQHDPSIMVALFALFILGAVLVALSVAKEVRGWKVSVLAHSSVWTRLSAGALGCLLLGGGVLLALNTSGDRSGDGAGAVAPSDRPSEPTQPPGPTVAEADLGTPEQVDFTFGAGPGLSDRCRDLDEPGTPIAENASFGLCAGGNEIDVHRGYGLYLWEETHPPAPMECVDQITRHGVQVTPVAVGSTLCVTTRENRVAVLTVESMGNGIRVSGDSWGPLVY